VSDDLDIPAFLRVTQRRPWKEVVFAWDDRKQPKRDWRRPKSMTDEEWAEWQEIEERKAAVQRALDEPRFQAMREKAAREREEINAVKAAAKKAHRRSRK
jgi:uncharacterized protein YbaA (DUF1428 family)